MDKNKMLLGAGGAALGTSAVLGSEAFSLISANRDITVAVARDPNAYVGMSRIENSPDSQAYVKVDEEGKLGIDIGNNSSGGEGVNVDGTTTFDRLFELCNQGTQTAYFWTTVDMKPVGDEEQTAYSDSPLEFYDSASGDSLTGPGNAVEVGVGGCVEVGLRFTTDTNVFTVGEYQALVGVNANVEKPKKKKKVVLPKDVPDNINRQPADQWPPEGCTEETYEVSGSFDELCDKLSGKNGPGPDGKQASKFEVGFNSQTEHGPPVRQYDVRALQVEIEFNDHGDHDPHGIVFALDQYADDIEDGTHHPEPLTLRANQGDCIEVTLKNELPSGGLDDNHEDPPMRVPRNWDSSERVSLHPERITYDPNGSDGATVGFNYDQTVGEGEEITYRWYADELYDNMVLTDEADVRGHRHHGAFGNLVIEPPETSWIDPSTGEALPVGVDAILKKPDNQADVREYTLSMSDGRYVINDNPDSCVVPAEDPNSDEACNKIGGFEDGGHGAINNRAEPFVRRLDDGPQHKVYDSVTHGDPATPVLRALTGDPVKFLVHEPADKARGMSFHLSGHQWPRWHTADESPVIGTDDRISPGKGIRLFLTSGAGGEHEYSGDYIFQDTKQRRRLESGLWGIFRVRDSVGDFGDPMQPLPDQANNVGPPGRDAWNSVFADVTGNGTDDFICGVPKSDIGAAGGGAVYIYQDFDQSTNLDDLSNADMALLGTDPGRHVGETIEVNTNGDGSPEVVVGTATNATLTVPGGQAMVDAISSPPKRCVESFLTNTTKNSIAAVYDIDNVIGGYPTKDQKNCNSSGSGGSTSGSNSLASAVHFLQCTECDQKSAPGGSASLWQESGETSDGTSVYECGACGNRQHMEM